jgi:hypothetical protein
VPDPQSPVQYHRRLVGAAGGSQRRAQARSHQRGDEAVGGRAGDRHVPLRAATGLGPEQMDEIIGGLSMLKRAPRLADVVATLAFLASDGAASITGTFVNITAGIFPS